MPSDPRPLLLADIGGTNGRVALLQPGEALPGPSDRFALDGFPGIAAALEAWLASRGGARPARAVLAVAGPVAANRVTLTNRGWVVDGAALAPALGFDAVRVVNDFEALAWSLPLLEGRGLFPLGGGAAAAGAPMVVLGPGTGLGVAAWLPVPGLVLATEGGHAALPAGTAREAAVIEVLRPRLGGHVSAERGALSGQGIENLHAAIAALDGAAVPARDAAEVVAAALRPEPCPVAAETFSMFCALLGGVAGDLALALGARGGVCIGGGICPRFPEALAASPFRARFEAKGRFRDWLAPVPTWLINHPDAAMLGLASLARRMGAA